MKNTNNLEKPTLSKYLLDRDRESVNSTDSRFRDALRKKAKAKEKKQKKLLGKETSERKKQIKKKREVKKSEITEKPTNKVKFSRKLFEKDININISFPYPVIALEIPLENKTILDITPLKKSETIPKNFEKSNYGKDCTPGTFEIFDKVTEVNNLDRPLISRSHRIRKLVVNKSTSNVGGVMAEEGVLVYNTGETGNTEGPTVGREE